MSLRNTLGAQLRSKLIQQQTNKDWDENPLVTVCLSPKILDLGFTDDELHDICEKWARRVFKTVHPDHEKDKETSDEKVQRFSKAFDLIKEPSIFKEVLREFKLINNQERSYSNETNRLLTKANEKVRLLEDKIQAYETISHKKPTSPQQPPKPNKPADPTMVPQSFQKPLIDMRKSQGVWVGFRDMLEKGEHPRSKLSDIQAVEQSEYVLAIKMTTNSARSIPDTEVLKLIKKQYDDGIKLFNSPKKDEHASDPSIDDLLRDAKLAFMQRDFNVADLREILERAQFQKNQFPRLVWTKNDSYIHYGFPRFSQKHTGRPEITPRYMDENPEFSKEFIIKRFLEGVKFIQERLLRGVWVQGIDWHPVILKLDSGFYTERKKHYSYKEQIDHSYKVLGTFLPKPELMVESMSNFGVIQEETLNKHVPQLIRRNSFLVSARCRYILPNGKTPEQQTESYFNRIQAIKRSYHVQYFVLEVK